MKTKTAVYNCPRGASHCVCEQDHDFVLMTCLEAGAHVLPGQQRVAGETARPMSDRDQSVTNGVEQDPEAAFIHARIGLMVAAGTTVAYPSAGSISTLQQLTAAFERAHVRYLEWKDRRVGAGRSG